MGSEREDMDDNEFLSLLGKEARRQQKAEESLDPRFDALAAGQLTAEEEKNLQKEAAESRDMLDDYEAFKPLGAEFRFNLVNRIHGELAAGKEDNVVKKQRSTRLWLIVAPAFALAASIALLLALPTNKPRSPLSYTFEMKVGEQTYRGKNGPSPDTAKPIFGTGSQIHIILRPKEASREDVGASLFFEKDGTFIRLENGQQINSSGAVRFTAIIGETVFLEPGEWTVWAVVGRPGDLPDRDGLKEAVRAFQTRRETSFDLFSKQITITGK